MRFTMLVLALSGCAYKVGLESVPPAAVVQFPDGTATNTPTTYVARWAPFNEVRIRATARGYRPLELDLRQSEVKFGRFFWRGLRFNRPRGVVQLILVPTHGPAGTWTEADLP